MPSNEFLNEVWAEAKKQLPGWAYAALLQAARPRAGGLASHRVDGPDIFAKIALTEIRPGKLSKLDEEELRSIWLRLHQWYANAKKHKIPVEEIVNAGVWIREEMISRGLGPGESVLTEEIDRLTETDKARAEQVRGKRGEDLPKFIGERLDKMPDEILLVRDFVSVAGSAAVAEKPNDIDVVIRAEYNASSGKYELDGAGLWVALRRFLSPDKRGPQIQLLSSPAGSFTDYVPVFDLVARKRVPQVVKIETAPPKYEGQYRVSKTLKSDRLILGDFFTQPKPMRPAYPGQAQTVDGLTAFYEAHKDRFPAWVQKKYDGVNHQIHKDVSSVKIFSEDGDDNTARLPRLVEAVKALPVHKGIFTAELEYWKDGQHYPREAVAGYLAERTEPDDRNIVANIYDVLAWKGEDIHGKPLRSRLECLKQLGEGTMETPNEAKAINVAPGLLVSTSGELRDAVDKIRKLPGSEGIVAKQLDSPYPIAETTGDQWVKFSNTVSFNAEIIKAYRAKGGVWTYDYGVRPGKDRAFVVVSELVPVGESLATGRKYEPGDTVTIEAETINKIETPEGVRLTAGGPRLLGPFDGEADTVDEVVNKATSSLVLRGKRVGGKGEVIEHLPANTIKTLRPEVPTVGPEKARLAFIGASPGRMEAARHEPFTGPGGETFNEVYLKPLGLRRDEVLLTNAVPVYLEEEKGQTREPTAEEIKEWSAWLTKQLDEHRPRVIVALGRTAEGALGERCDYTLPHPSAVRRFGDSGEVGRKLKQIKERITIAKQLPKSLTSPRAEGGTRATTALDNWDKQWASMLPMSGRGDFVYQHHWRGLDEDETKLEDAELIKDDRSLHGDIRLTGDQGLWGFAVFLGRTEDNREKKENDKLIDWKPDDNIEVSPKLAQPRAWLEVGADKPMISPPGEVGSTSEKYSKFFAVDKGSYQLGVARQHMIEIFLDGGHLKGRYLFLYVPVAGRRRWLIDKPEDQTPYAATRDLADVLGELKAKGQKYLIWAKPGERPKKYDVRTGREIEKKSPVTVSKADTVKKIVYGIVLDSYSGSNGQPEGDAHNDWTPPSDIEKTAHEWLKNSRMIGLQHKKPSKANVVESWIEQYPSRGDYVKAMRGEDHKIFSRKFGTDVLHSGAWVLGVQLSDVEWSLYEDGKINGFSPGGMGARHPIERRDMPKVQVIELVEKRPGNA